MLKYVGKRVLLMVPTLLGVEPLGKGAGSLALRLDLAAEGGRWEVAVTTRAGTRTFNYSALFAYGAVRGGRRR